MNAARSVLAALALIGLASCTYPYENVNVTDERPSIAFKSAPSGSTVYVDGVEMGSAGAYNGRDRVLRIEPGTHVVQIRRGSEIIWSQTVFMGARATKTFLIP